MNTDQQAERGGFWGQLVHAARAALHYGNTHFLTVERGERTAVDLPLTLVAVGALFAPWLVAIGLVAAVVTGSSIRLRGSDEGLGSTDLLSAEGIGGTPAADTGGVTQESDPTVGSTPLMGDTRGPGQSAG